jgi:hypothetical protein
VIYRNNIDHYVRAFISSEAVAQPDCACGRLFRLHIYTSRPYNGMRSRAAIRVTSKQGQRRGLSMVVGSRRSSNGILMHDGTRASMACGLRRRKGRDDPGCHGLLALNTTDHRRHAEQSQAIIKYLRWAMPGAKF